MSETTSRKYVRRGNGAATHIAKEYRREDGSIYLVAALCDGWGATAARRVTYVAAEGATCKTCQKIAAAQGE